jgi:dihydrofolate reductase
MLRPQRIEGHAIISADGMIADHNGVQPPELIVKADQRIFRRSLDHAAAVAHGRFSHERGPGAANRKRLVLTRRIESIAPHPRYRQGVLWNPAGASFQEAWRALDAPDGVLAVIGGTETFALFLEIGYDAFHLTRANRAHLPDGRPVFPDVPLRTPEDMLASHGLKPSLPQSLDVDADVVLVTWHA